MRRVVPVLLFAVLAVLWGCASGGAGAAAKPKVAPKPAQVAKAPEPEKPTTPVVEASLTAVPAPPPEPVALPDTVDGPDIPRPALLLVLEQGVGRFLQKVRIEPHLERGRFRGWRILELFDGEPEMSRGVLQPGDTLVRVNGQSIERPEQFKNVWDSLATESQLVLQVVRAGKASEIRHRIVQSSTSVVVTRPAAGPVSRVP